MPDTQTQDEVVSNRTGTRGGLSSRPTEEETVSASGSVARTNRAGIEDENHDGGGKRGRAYKQSTEELLARFEKETQDVKTPASHEEGDADEEESAGDDAAGVSDSDASGEAAPNGDNGSDEDVDGQAAADGEPSEGDDAPDPAAEWQSKASTLEQRNRELLSELDTARKTPKSQRTERETALVAAESAYIEEGSVAAIRKFLSVITGAAADSKEVDAELAGLYTDLTARELGVPLDENQRTLRDNARTRLLLARDKREKVEAEKKPVADNSADDVQYGEATKHVDSLLGTKGQSGTSLADEYPMLMTLAQDFDGYPPGEVLARAIRQEIMTGTLDPKTTSDVDMVRTVAPKIEKHYDGLAKRIEAARAKQKKPGTTPSAKPKAAPEASTEQRQSTEARTLSNAAASRAPAKLPKATVVKGKQTAAKTRKDFPSDKAWKDHLLNMHFKS